MSKYVLDMNKWRCGRSGANQLGTGPTRMVNEDGFMCCLGQFACQCGVEPTGFSPEDVAMRENRVYDEAFVRDDTYEDHTTGETLHSYESTTLACLLMDINDDMATTPDEKVALIREALEEAGHELEVVPISGGLIR